MCCNLEVYFERTFCWLILFAALHLCTGQLLPGAPRMRSINIELGYLLKAEVARAATSAQSVSCLLPSEICTTGQVARWKLQGQNWK